MKLYLLLFSLAFAPLVAQACDENLQIFSRDCAIQDRFSNLKNKFSAKGIDINEIADYRVIRFVDRYNWDRAIDSHAKPKDIYQPAPATWIVWDSGIREIMNTAGHKGSLFNEFVLDRDSIGNINANLLEHDGLNVKDKVTDKSLKVGQYREAKNTGVGFLGGSRNYKIEIAESEKSMDRFQEKWELAIGSTFEQLLVKENVQLAVGANLRSGMSQKDGTGFVFYAPSSDVTKDVDRIKHFIKINLDQYKEGRPVLSPIELATVVQKWLVSVHPFSDGNGRTSRAVQDIILANFDMPAIPGGDLQNDALEQYEKYIENTYRKTEMILAKLEDCLDENKNAKLFQCQTIATIDAMAVTNQSFPNVKRSKD